MITSCSTQPLLCNTSPFTVCVCVSTPGQRVFHRHLLHQFSTKFHSQGGQACHIQPGPTKLGCGRGSTKGRFGVYLQQLLHKLSNLFCCFHGSSCYHPQTHHSLTAVLLPRCADRVTDRLCRLEQFLKHQVFGPFTLRFFSILPIVVTQLTEYNCQSVFRSAVPLGC